MHIAVDARELAGKRTGVGTYLAHLLDEWAQMPAACAHRWTLYVAEGGRRQPAGEAIFERRTLPGRPGTWWEQCALARAMRRDRPDVLFAPGYTAPLLTRTPTVVTIHDVSFFAHPEWFGRREGFRRRLLTRRSARRARSILTVSEFSRQEIVARLGVPAARVQVILHGVSRPASPPPGDPRPRVVLYVGSIFNRRHVPDLIRAFAALLPDVPDARLEIVGDNRTHPRQDLDALARALGVSDRVNVRAYVGDEELESLYRQAAAFAFLSEYEGFAFTPLEALAHSVPPLLADTSVGREIYADAALYVRPADPGGIRDGLRRLLLEVPVRRTQLENGRQLLARYCWGEAARRTLEVLEQAGGRD